jgi:hypothetical protein
LLHRCRLLVLFHDLPLAVALPPLLAVEPPHAVDHVTDLPLIVCLVCKDLRVDALTTMNSLRNCSRCFFKCPRNHQYVSDFV